MMQRYSAFSLFRNALGGHGKWQPAWRKARPQKAYDAIVIGGGGHGLATAYYLAKRHRIRNVAVLERGWIGGGNTGRNTTVIRSNYFYPESVALYDLALRLYEGLSKELNYNVMLSQRGMLIGAHTPMQMEICQRIANAMQLNGVDGELMTADQASRKVPLYNTNPDARYKLMGGIWQGRAGVARHDAVAWGYARAASALGVDIIEGCEVNDIIVNNGAVA
ncbi:MAG: FAD-dependent oxidoreductase, partial [Pseudomonadota bacterium]